MQDNNADGTAQYTGSRPWPGKEIIPSFIQFEGFNGGHFATIQERGRFVHVKQHLDEATYTGQEFIANVYYSKRLTRSMG